MIIIKYFINNFKIYIINYLYLLIYNKKLLIIIIILYLFKYYQSIYIKLLK